MTPAERPRGWSVRQRLLVMMVSLMALGLALTGVLSFTLQFGSLAERVDAELAQEVQEVSALAEAGPERDGVPYTDVEALLTTFLETAVSGESEAFLTLVDGQPFRASGGSRAFDVSSPEFVDLVTPIQVGDGQARIESLRTQDTRLRVIIADVQLPGETREGTFVAAIDIGRQQGLILRRMLTFAGVALAVLLISGALAQVVLGRLLRPLRELRETTAQISSEDLSRRVRVTGDSDVAELAIRFNEMLDRIEDGVRHQREFLDDAAHELRTPLTILRGNAELLRPDDPEEVAATRVLLLDEVDRMQRLVDELLMLARSQRHDFLRVRDTDLTELAVDAMERITSLGDRQWRLSADAEGVLAVDRQRMIQALVQLGANAVKFSDRGSVVELATSFVESDPTRGDAEGERGPGGGEEAARARSAGARPARRYLALSVSDHGTGIPEREQPRVFERFGRAEGAAQVDGSGLGLAIVRAIAEAHGGGVGVESVEGLGSRFTIWIPADGREEGQAAPAPRNTALATTGR